VEGALTNKQVSENVPEFWRNWYTRSGRRLSFAIILVVVAWFGSCMYLNYVARKTEWYIFNQLRYYIVVETSGSQIVAVADSEVQSTSPHATIAMCEVYRAGPVFRGRSFWRSLIVPAEPLLRYETQVRWQDELHAAQYGLSSARQSDLEVLSGAINAYNQVKAPELKLDTSHAFATEEKFHAGLAACLVVYWLLCLGLVWSLLAFITSSFVEPSNYRPRADRI
jgi:hypothetical protein